VLGLLNKAISSIAPVSPFQVLGSNPFDKATADPGGHPDRILAPLPSLPFPLFEKRFLPWGVFSRRADTELPPHTGLATSFDFSPPQTLIRLCVFFFFLEDRHALSLFLLFTSGSIAFAIQVAPPTLGNMLPSDGTGSFFAYICGFPHFPKVFCAFFFLS